MRFTLEQQRKLYHNRYQNVFKDEHICKYIFVNKVSFIFQLIDQLTPGGRIICPVVAIEGFQRFQDLVQVDKNIDGTITKKKLMQVSYIPLTDPATQLLND